MLALVVAYFLSKYDEFAYESLGFRHKGETHDDIGSRLGVKGTSVKNMRDEFDPVHDTPRVGWHQRAMTPTRLKVIELFQHLPKEDLLYVVQCILHDNEGLEASGFEQLLNISEKREASKGSTSRVFTSRGKTGRRAEEFFIQYFKDNNMPCPGELVDRRDDGCGYDFEVINEGARVQVEVKGLDSESGGITLTSKEWRVAEANPDTYFLAIIRNVSDVPTIQIIRDPVSRLSVTKSIYTCVQINWNVSERELSKVGLPR